LPLFDGQRHWLFAIDVLAGSQGVDSDLRVPVIRGADGHHVDVLAIEDVTIIFVRRAARILRGKCGAVRLVDVGTREHVTHLGNLVTKAGSPTSHANCTNADLVRGGVRG